MWSYIPKVNIWQPSISLLHVGSHLIVKKVQNVLSKQSFLRENQPDHSWGLIQSLKIECLSTLKCSVIMCHPRHKTQGILLARVPHVRIIETRVILGNFPEPRRWACHKSHIPIIPWCLFRSNQPTPCDSWENWPHQWIYFLSPWGNSSGRLLQIHLEQNELLNVKCP